MTCYFSSSTSSLRHRHASHRCASRRHPSRRRASSSWEAYADLVPPARPTSRPAGPAPRPACPARPAPRPHCRQYAANSPQGSLPELRKVSGLTSWFCGSSCSTCCGIGRCGSSCSTKRYYKSWYSRLYGRARWNQTRTFHISPARSGEQGPCLEEGPVLGPISGGWF
jgi:hypothetical protein